MSFSNIDGKAKDTCNDKYWDDLKEYQNTNPPFKLAKKNDSLKLNKSLARFYQPIGFRKVAKRNCKVLVTSAHPDDVEIMGHKWSHKAYQKNERDFFGVVCANGAGKTPRMEKHKKLSVSQMTNLRYDEQQEAAKLGLYGGIWMLAYPSREICRKVNYNLVTELRNIILATQPEVIITHNPLDLHATHISVFYHTCLAIHTLPKKIRPIKFYGAEGWGDISRWYVSLGENKKTGVSIIDCSKSISFLKTILEPFKSQNGIMSYDTAVPDLLRTRAQLMDPHRKTNCNAVQVIFDMHEVLNEKMSPLEYLKFLLLQHEIELEKSYKAFK